MLELLCAATDTDTEPIIKENNRVGEEKAPFEFMLIIRIVDVFCFKIIVFLLSLNLALRLNVNASE